LARAFSSSRRPPPSEGVELVLGRDVEQHLGLEPVTALAGQLCQPVVVDGLLHRADDEPQPELGDEPVAQPQDLVEVVARVDVQDGERHPRGMERLHREPQHHQGILTAGEQQCRSLELGGDLADDVDRLRLQRLQLGQAVVMHGTRGWHGPSRGSGVVDKAPAVGPGPRITALADGAIPRGGQKSHRSDRTPPSASSAGAQSGHAIDTNRYPELLTPRDAD